MSLDYSYLSELNEFVVPGTGVELPAPGTNYRYEVPRESVSVASGETNWGDTITGAFKSAVATGESLLNFYGNVQGLKAQKATMDYTQQLQKAAISSATAKIQSDAELAKITANSNVEIARLQADKASAIAAAQAQAARDGHTYISVPGGAQGFTVTGYLSIAAIAAAAWMLLRSPRAAR
jgi:hypothetical protein